MRGRRRISIWTALPPYLGGKRRLCPIIFRELDKVLPRRRWPGMTFVDAFLGGGSVALYAKAQGFNVVATDIAERSIIVGEALIENSRVRLTREDVLKMAARGDGSPGRIERDYSPKVFTRQQARFLDGALHAASIASHPAKAALYRLLAMRVALKAHPMSQVRAGTINKFETGEVETISEKCVSSYVDGMRLTRPEKLWELAQ